MTRGGRALVSTLIALPMFVVLIGLGVWQVERLQRKLEMIAERDAGFTQAPIELTARDADLAGLAWRRVTVTGRFDHDHELHLWHINTDGNAGYDVLTPFVRTDSTDGQVLLVDRGWVPIAAKEATTRAAGQVQGTVTINGFVRLDLEGRTAVTPQNDPARNSWYFVDYAAMAKQAGVPLRPLVVVADASPNPGGLPIGLARPPELTNRHLGYALTWFSLAAALAVIFGLSLRRQLAAPDPAA